MNILESRIFSIEAQGYLSLPEVLAACAAGPIGGFPALRPHQCAAWHMFRVQLAALALWKAGRTELPADAGEWAALLRALTSRFPEDDPWQLIPVDPSRPGFMQPPAPAEGQKWTAIETPDALDLLITSRNHDLKQTIARQAEMQDWAYALISLQTSEGFGGAGNYGIARMNGGSSSRPMLALAPVEGAATGQRHPGDLRPDIAAWWRRDVRCLLDARARQVSEYGAEGLGKIGGPALLWCQDWPQNHQFDIRSLDPWFIDVCRRVRLVCSDGRLQALRSTSKSARIEAKAQKGSVGDPWAPVHKAENKSLTLGEGDFDYRRLCDLLLSNEWDIPLLAKPAADERSDMLLIAEALSRGNSKTDGLKSRVIPVPGKVVPSFFATVTAGKLAKQQINEIDIFLRALGFALALYAAQGDWDKLKKDHYKFAGPARQQFDRTADRLFFPNLWRRLNATDGGKETVDAARKAFLTDLMGAAKLRLQAAMPGIPCAAIWRHRAESRALRTFDRIIHSEFSVLRPSKEPDTPIPRAPETQSEEVARG